MAFAKIAVWPALTVCDVAPAAVTEKSGGGAGVIVKLTALEYPPGGGSPTITGKVPGPAPFKKTLAVICVEFTRFSPMRELFPMSTTAPCWKFVPLMVKVIGFGVPDCPLVGLIEVIVGIGLGVIIVKGSEVEGPPLGDGFEIVT